MRKRQPKVEPTDKPELIERVVDIRRCSKVVKGGRRFSFSALVVVGDGKGQVGFGLGKAQEVAEAIPKAVDVARKNIITVSRNGNTISHSIVGHYGAARVLLKPASPGTGVVAGGGVRALLELSGIKDVYAKAVGSRNPFNLIRAGLEGLNRIRDREEAYKLRRGK
jgi:small subunit ribosomal protein S5